MTASAAERPMWWFRTPRERVVRPDILVAAFNRRGLGLEPGNLTKARLVYDLACGHQEIGRLGSRSLHCSSCQKIVDLGLDYDGFRRHGLRDPLLDLPADGELDRERAAAAESRDSPGTPAAGDA